MKLIDLNEKYDLDHKCKTPDAIYSITLKNKSVNIKVEMPDGIKIPDDKMENLESDLHYAVEKVLAKFF